MSSRLHEVVVVGLIRAVVTTAFRMEFTPGSLSNLRHLRSQIKKYPNWNVVLDSSHTQDPDSIIIGALRFAVDPLATRQAVMFVGEKRLNDPASHDFSRQAQTFLHHTNTIPMYVIQSYMADNPELYGYTTDAIRKNRRQTVTLLKELTDRTKYRPLIIGYYRTGSRKSEVTGSRNALMSLLRRLTPVFHQQIEIEWVGDIEDNLKVRPFRTNAPLARIHLEPVSVLPDRRSLPISSD